MTSSDQPGRELRKFYARAWVNFRNRLDDVIYGPLYWQSSSHYRRALTVKCVSMTLDFWNISNSWCLHLEEGICQPGDWLGIPSLATVLTSSEPKSASI